MDKISSGDSNKVLVGLISQTDSRYGLKILYAAYINYIHIICYIIPTISYDKLIPSFEFIVLPSYSYLF